MTYKSYFSDKKQTHYQDEEPIDFLWFKENFPQFHQQLYEREINSMNVLHSLYFVTEDETRQDNNTTDALDILHLPVHPVIREVFLSDRILTAYELIGLDLFQPQQKEHIDRFCKMITETIQLLHQKHYYVADLRPDLIYWNAQKQNADTLSFHPNLTSVMKPLDTSEQTLIAHRTIISPLHILWDMLNSKYEANTVEYKEFKKKFMIFWESVVSSKPQFRDVIKFCQHVYGKFTGEDYIDYVLIKFCMIESINDKYHIIKDAKKIKTKDFLCKLDWFALAFLIKSYQEHIGRDPATSMVFQCISFQYDPQ